MALTSSKHTPADCWHFLRFNTYLTQIQFSMNLLRVSAFRPVMRFFEKLKLFRKPVPEFSIIVCSHKPERAHQIRSHYTKLFRNESYEIIIIADAKSLCEGYTRGLALSRADRLIFSHDDVEFVTPDVPARLRSHLDNYDLVGIAGTTRLVNGSWVAAGDPHIFGLVVYPDTQGFFSIRYAGKGPLCVEGIQALDGCFLACKRIVAETIGFDAETFDGFHFYDLDFTFAAHLRGFRLAVCRDLALIHLSMGNHDAAWMVYRQRFEAKYAGRLVGTEGSVISATARVPRAALANWCTPDHLIKSFTWE